MLSEKNVLVKTLIFIYKTMSTKKIFMTTKEILSELKEYGNEQTKSTLMRHGAKEPFFGVKVQDLKKILKKNKEESRTLFRAICYRKL